MSPAWTTRLKSTFSGMVGAVLTKASLTNDPRGYFLMSHKKYRRGWADAQPGEVPPIETAPAPWCSQKSRIIPHVDSTASVDRRVVRAFDVRTAHKRLR